MCFQGHWSLKGWCFKQMRIRNSNHPALQPSQSTVFEVWDVFPVLVLLLPNDEALLMALLSPAQPCTAHNGRLVNWPFDSDAHPLLTNCRLINEVLTLLALPPCLEWSGCLFSGALMTAKHALMLRTIRTDHKNEHFLLVCARLKRERLNNNAQRWFHSSKNTCVFLSAIFILIWVKCTWFRL